VFETATFADLARAVGRAPRVAADEPEPTLDSLDPAELLARVEDLSDAQVEALLAELGSEPVSGT